MKVLAIETSCDETAVAVLDIDRKDNIKVLSNVVSSQIKLHAKYGGVVPNLAAREHVKNIGPVFKSALEEADIKNFKKEIDLVAVTRGPGLGPSLLIGLTFAKSLAWLNDKPIVGVDHMRGHIHSNWLGEVKITKKIFPALNLVVSGGHTELVLMTDYEKYKVVGETLDDAVGEAFDKVARLLDLGYPGGPIISKCALSGEASRYPLPSPMLNSKDFNFSYSGLKTAVLYLLRDLKSKSDVTEKIKSDIAASFQKAAVNVLIRKTAKACVQFGVKSLMLSGGVAANRVLREELQKLAGEIKVNYFMPPMAYTTDNAAMIGVAGYFAYKKAKNKTAHKWQSVQMNANLSF
jgi:N6-L-threonylcarbamoyladenine synthase